MNYKDIYKHAYLQQLNIIKESATEEIAAETEVKAEATPKKVCFLTTDTALIDALNSGIEEVVLFVNTKDEATGEDNISEVKIGKDSFGELEITEVEEDEDDAEDAENELEEGVEGEDDAEDAGEEEDEDEEEDEEESEEPELAKEDAVEGEVDAVEGEVKEVDECKETLTECNKILSSIKAQRFSKYGPY